MTHCVSTDQFCCFCVFQLVAYIVQMFIYVAYACLLAVTSLTIKVDPFTGVFVLFGAITALSVITIGIRIVVDLFVMWQCLRRLSRIRHLGTLPLPTADDPRLQDKRPTCLDEMAPVRSAVRRTPCGHLFHRRCLLLNARVTWDCPMCRAIIVFPVTIFMKLS